MELIALARWRATCTAMGLTDVDAEHGKLVHAWRGWGRRYHTLDHLAACLRELDGARDLAQHPPEVELALWFHDAVYRTYRPNNETLSADWAARFVASHRGTAEATERIRQMILATAHGPGKLDGDQPLVVDIDLSILGQPQPIYDQFEQNVRREYWWVPKARYAQARRNILKSFIARPAIYHWPRFRDRYEKRARANLERAIAALQ